MSSPGKAKNIFPAKVSLFFTETCGLDKGSQTQSTGERKKTEKKEEKNYHSVQHWRHSEDIKNIRQDRCHFIIFSHTRAVCLVKPHHSEAVVECCLQSTTSNKPPKEKTHGILWQGWDKSSSVDVSPSLCISHSTLRTVLYIFVQVPFLVKGEAR